MGYKTIGGNECWVGNDGCHFYELFTSNNEEEDHHFHDDDGDCDDDDEKTLTVGLTVYRPGD